VEKAEECPNASVIIGGQGGGFLSAALARLPVSHPMVLVSDDPALADFLSADMRLSYNAAGFDGIPIRFAEIRETLGATVAESGAALIVVDMRWGHGTVSATANFENWGTVCDQIARADGVGILSIYDRDLMIEDQLLSALRAHSHFLAPSGLFDNPYWLPPAYLNGATLTEQILYLIGRLVPDYQETEVYTRVVDDAATGANPHWLQTPRRIRPPTGTAEAWKIRCFGRLRIYRADSSQIKWDIPGSAPKKSKTLFAYLLHCGERGARADQLAELLWPDEPGEDTKRARLHHAIAMLRKTLGGKGFVLRNGEYYSLAPPPGSWIDISSFEQLCNRAKSLAKSGQDEEAMTVLNTAAQLYSGDLLEDIPSEYTETEMEDWLIPRRVWLRDMAVKVQRDKAEILRRKGRLREALDCCQKALAMDPISEIAHAEAMRIFHAQGRPETVLRQHRQYLANLEGMGLGKGAPEVAKLARELSSSN
jgi:DNA-binding transcriptional activator of the SARP family